MLLRPMLHLSRLRTMRRSSEERLLQSSEHNAISVGRLAYRFNRLE